MDGLNRALAFLGVSSIVLVAVAEARPQWLAVAGLDHWGLAEAHAELEQELQRGEGLETVRANLLLRSARRRETALAVVEGRLDLFTAAARFRELNDLRPCNWSVERARFKGCSDDEIACRQVIAWVRDRKFEWSAGQQTALLARLEAQLAEALRQPGGLRLPREQ